MSRCHTAMLLVLFASASPVVAGPARPNIIILMTDDQGYADLSCHGNPVLKTPNLDKLHSESVRFTSHHSAPMCTPTRGQLMTGQDALRNGATSVTAGRAFMRPGIPTLAEVLRAAGYRTGIFGKWHLGDNYPHRPNDRGFEEAVYHKGWGITSAPEFANTLFDGRYFHNAAEKRYKGYCTDFWFDQAMSWIKERKQKNESFFCYLPTNAPHAPHEVPEKYLSPFSSLKGKKGGPAAFFGMIANIDDNFGRLERFLRDNDLHDNTIVIYMTDNGGTAGVNLFNAGMRGRKTTYYEGGHRVPCFVRWPALKTAPIDIALPTQIQDIMPTLLDLCGVKTPANAYFDGTSLAGLVRGTQKSLADRMLVVQYGQIPKKWDSCVLWNNWRLVHGTELYDLAKDPAQETDVATRQPEVLAKMKGHYEQWWAKIEPSLKNFVTISLGSEKENPVYITSSDWQDIYADNAGHVRKGVGGPQGGFWNVKVERDGMYEISLRRWPRELDLALNTDSGKDSVAFPIAAARLQIQGQALNRKGLLSGEKEATFTMSLKAGTTRLQGTFQDVGGGDLCGAFFATIRRNAD